MRDESWLRVINLHVLTLSKAIPNFSQKKTNSAIGTVAGLFDTSNDGGIYRKQFKFECPYNGLRRGVWFIYIRPKGGEAPSEPSQASDFEDVYAKYLSLLQGRNRDAGECNDDHNAAKIEAKKASTNNIVPEKPNIYSISYWYSKDAANLFGFDYDKEDNLIDGLKDIIKLLTGDFTDWKRGVDKVVTRSGEHMTKFSIFTLQNKCIYLRKAYKIALGNWGGTVRSSG